MQERFVHCCTRVDVRYNLRETRFPEAQCRLRLSGASYSCGRIPETPAWACWVGHGPGPAKWNTNRPKLFETWPGKMKVGCKARHVMHSKYLVKINEGAMSAKKPFSRRPQRGDCARAGIKMKFPSVDNCSLACLLSSTHLPRPLLKTHTNCPGTQCI